MSVKKIEKKLAKKLKNSKDKATSTWQTANFVKLSTLLLKWLTLSSLSLNKDH